MIYINLLIIFLLLIFIHELGHYFAARLFGAKITDFSKLTLSPPTGVQGGAYFSKLKYNGEKLVIQTPKCGTKQGIKKTGKKRFLANINPTNYKSIQFFGKNGFSHIISTFQNKIEDV